MARYSGCLVVDTESLPLDDGRDFSSEMVDRLGDLVYEKGPRGNLGGILMVVAWVDGWMDG